MLKTTYEKLQTQVQSIMIKKTYNLTLWSRTSSQECTKAFLLHVDLCLIPPFPKTRNSTKTCDICLNLGTWFDDYISFGNINTPYVGNFSLVSY